MAREKGAKEASASLLPVGEDPRPPMMRVYELLAGRAELRSVFLEAEAVQPAARDRARFYAHLYTGLYHEARSEADQARYHIDLAANLDLRPIFMSRVAAMHARRLVPD